MRISSLPPRTQILLSLLVPLCCLGIAALLILPSVTRIKRVNHNIEAAKQQIQDKQEVIAQAEMVAGGRPLALAVASPNEDEPIIFLRQLAELMNESRVTLVAVRDMAPRPNPAAAGGQYSSRNAATPSSGAAGNRSTPVLRGERPVVPPSVQELANQVTVQGAFGEILELVLRLEKFDRILSVSQCKISTGGTARYPKLQAVFLLSRFVAMPESTTAEATSQPLAGR